MSPPCWSGCPTTRAGATRSCQRSATSFTDAWVRVRRAGRPRQVPLGGRDARVRARGRRRLRHDRVDGRAAVVRTANVGMWGDSYYGYTQWAAVASEHPALKAIVPRVTTADLAGSAGRRPGDRPSTSASTWRCTGSTTRSTTGRPTRSPAAGGGLRRRVRGDRPARRELRPVRDHERGRRAPGAAIPGHHPFDVLRIPVLHTGGWFDNIMPEQMRDYDALIARPDLADLQYLEMNSTDHENYHLDLVPIRPESTTTTPTTRRSRACCLATSARPWTSSTAS